MQFAPNSTIGGGSDNVIQANAPNSTIAGGSVNLIQSGGSATIGGGDGNVAGAPLATVPGGLDAAASNYAQMAYSAGQFAKPGDSQASWYLLRGQTGLTVTNGSQLFTTNLCLDGSSLQISLPASRSFAFNMRVIARIPGNSGQTTSVFTLHGGASEDPPAR